MKREEANAEAMRLFSEWNKKTDAVYQRLSEEGHVFRGLDGPVPPEVKAVDDEYRRKIQELAAQIDDIP